MTAALEAAFEELQDSGEPEVVREIIATRIIAAAKFGERDPARLLAAALRRPDQRGFCRSRVAVMSVRPNS